MVALPLGSWCTVGAMAQGPVSEVEWSPAELRYHPRVRLRAPFACSFAHRGIRRWFGRDDPGLGIVFNLSMTGVKVLGETDLKPGDRLSMNLRLPKQTSPMSVEEGTVRWVQDHMFGLEFTRLSPAEEWRLWKFMELAAKRSR